MTGSPEAQVTLAFELGAEVIGGEVRLAGRPATPFTGWVGLLSALGEVVESLTDDARPQPAGAWLGSRADEVSRS